MKEEKSAGGIVIKKISSEWNVLVITDMSGKMTFPKGMIKNNENVQEAAVREVAEETGISRLEFIKNLGEVRYFYRKNGLRRKSVKYMLFITGYDGQFKPQHDEGIKDAAWIPIDSAPGIIGYPETNIPILKKTLKYLSD